MTAEKLPEGDVGVLDYLRTVDRKGRGECLPAYTHVWETKLGVACVFIGRSDLDSIVDHVEERLQAGVLMIHLLARGNEWILKAHRVAHLLVQNMRVNVFSYSEDEELLEKGTTPVAVVSLLTTELLQTTDPTVWSEEVISQWEEKVGAFREAVRG